MPPTPSPDPILIQMVGGGDSAPWWGVPAVAGAFLIIGAVLGFYFNRQQEKWKAKREDVRKWDDKILEKSAEYIQTADRLAALAETPHGREDSRQLARLRSDLDDLSSYLSLITPDELRDPLAYVLSASLDVEYSGSEDWDGPGNLRTMVIAYDKAVRQHFGVATVKKRPSRSAPVSD